ncbi:MAG: non-homologous end-joining DNA ligase [Verrucomicrobia bacterium]|nr:non-homologous end-joining DNA ligase [Verrucomicrobiota bacterium]
MSASFSSSRRGLSAYRRKRDLARSGEPAGGSAGEGAPRYVIQKHDATRLHFDLRLEMEGVYRSWAVPKGLPTRVGERVLAVEVEDHPLDYGDFEGVIPSGNYGAGTVMMWDRGVYTVAGETPSAAFRSGKIHFALLGEKCSGEWTLVRLRRKEGDKTNWLLIKNRESRRRSVIKRAGRERSVLSGRTLAEIAAGEAPKAKPPSPEKSRMKPTPKKHAPVHWVEPMKALGVTRLPVGDLLYEIKLDGYRALANVFPGGVELWSRSQKSLTHQYPEISTALAQWKIGRALVDGEIVALDTAGRSSFQLLQGLQLTDERPPLRYYAFDLLWHDGVWLLDQPLETRQRTLAALCAHAPEEIRLSPVFTGDPQPLLDTAIAQGLEGVIAKEPQSSYEPGQRSGAWKKYRLAHDQEMVIGGFTPPKGSRGHFGALLIGYYDAEGALRYAGKVGAGFDRRRLKELHELFVPLQTKTCPFSDLPAKRRPRFGTGMTAAVMKNVTWLKPSLVCQVRFNEWTRDGLLRQPVFLGLRDDKRPHEVVREAVATG